MIQYLLSQGADREARDAHGDSPLSWASAHLRPGSVLALLAFGDFKIGENSRTSITSDHGAGWGNGMERKFVGELGAIAPFPAIFGVSRFLRRNPVSDLAC
jgi:hypothetical protein